MATFLTRRITFTAAHRYRVASWSQAKNLDTFGSFAHSHRHDYTCDVTVTGVPDPVTGFVVELTGLDRVLHEEVSKRFHWRDINVDIPEFGDAGMLPSTENLARFICERVQAGLGDSVRVVRVVVAESKMLSATYEP